MASHKTCDNCGSRITEENPLVLKLFLAPIRKGHTRKTASNYTHHQDIGQCCLVKTRNRGQWQQRKKQERSANGSGAGGASTSVATGKKRPARKT